MSKAWVSREYIDENGKRKRTKMPPGVNGVGKDDVFVVFYLDPSGKQRQVRIGIKGRPGKRAADEKCDQLTASLTLGTYEASNKSTWEQFRQEYDRKVLSNMSASTKQLTKDALKRFEEICKPQLMKAITTASIEDFVNKRRKQEGKKPKSTISPASVNKELRHLRAVFNIAAEWNYLDQPPNFRKRFLREIETLKPYVLPEDFLLLYEGAEHARFPRIANLDPATWWRALYVTLDMTGWRIGQMLELKWADVDLERGFIITRGDDNKGKRDTRVNVHPIVVEHLQPLQASFADLVFHWPHDHRTLWAHFEELQTASGVKPSDWMKKDHYGFHDFRRGFATKNQSLDATTLQHAMQHKSFSTTLKYINAARQTQSFVDKLQLPNLPKKETG